MMRRAAFSPTVFGKSLIVFLISICMLSLASATLVPGSSGSVTIIGNDPDYSTGSFKVLVDYAIYDGTSTSDPNGLTTNWQIAFTLTHLGGDGETPVLKFGRFLVFAPDIDDPVAFYKSINAFGTGKAPSSKRIYPYGSDPHNYARFSFTTGLDLADFAPGDVSKTLVLTTPSSNLPASVILEIDKTDTVPGVDGDVTVNFVPEPTSMALFGIASLFVLRRRRKI